MKVISQEESDAHYSQVIRGGVIGGTVGGILGLGGLALGIRRYAVIRNLTLPFKTFLVSSASTFGAIVVAERYSVNFQRAKDPMTSYVDSSRRALEEARAREGGSRRLLDWARENRYSIVSASWAGSIGLAFALVSRNRFLTGSQKLVQARMYAQGLTLAVLIATGLLEMGDAKSGKGRWETVMVVDPDDPEHKHLIEKKVHKEEYEGQDLWKDMVASEERRLNDQKKKRQEAEKKKDAETSSQPAN